jgi:hypothetical protein
MKALSLAALVCTIALFLWLPARTPAWVFDEVRIAEAALIEEGTASLPGAARSAAAAFERGFLAAARFPETYRLRPYAREQSGNVLNDRLARAGRNAARTPWFRSVLAMGRMAAQRLGIASAALLGWLPAMAAFFLDGLLSRRLRAEAGQAARPSLWSASVLALAAIAFAVPILALIPEAGAGRLCLAGAFSLLPLWLAASSWHRFP